jgi:class 3 adenylate cyclase
MADLPSGVVTFLFTDIEGSTSVWEQHPQAMTVALARHDAIIRQAIVAHDGVVFRTGGDAFCAAFASALAALNAALVAQRGLHTERWHPIESLRVRMALHTSAVELRDGDYLGPPLNRIARLLAAAYGGQTLLSRATQQLVAHQLPPAAALKELGEHQLKDLIEPEQIFQLVAPDLPDDFPPLKTSTRLDDRLDATAPQQLSDEPEQREHAWRQAKLPGMPQIDYDSVRERERERERQRRARKRKPKNVGDMF